jgi:hypothetical protein
MARGIRGASLDDPSWRVPMANIWTCKAYPWETLSPHLKSFETQPREDEWPSVLAEQARRFQQQSDPGSG